MKNILELLSFVSKIQREIVQDLNTIMRENSIHISGDNLSLLYELEYNDNISPQQLAKKSQYMIQQLMFQIKTLENKKIISLDNNSIIFADQKIHIQDQNKVHDIFQQVNNIYNNKKINDIKKNIINHLNI